MNHFIIENSLITPSNTLSKNGITFLEVDKLNELNQYLELSSELKNECVSPSFVNKVDITENYVFISLLRINPQKSNEQDPDIFHCIVTGDQLFFIYSHKLDLNNYIEQLNSMLHLFAITTGDALTWLYVILLETIHYDRLNLETIDDVCFDIESQLIENNNSDVYLRILTIRKTLSLYKKSYYTLEELLLSISEYSGHRHSQNIRALFDKLSNRTRWILQELTNLIDYTGQLRDLYHSQLNESMNKTMNLFTIISAIFLPLTLLVGWYGMNFSNMPELEWEYGYLVVIIVSIAIVSLLLYIYKKKNYFK